MSFANVILHNPGYPEGSAAKATQVLHGTYGTIWMKLMKRSLVMKKSRLIGIGAVVVAVGVVLGGCTPMKSMMGIAFGTDDDVAYGNQLWQKMEAKGFNSVKGDLHVGTEPHGNILEVLEGKIDGKTVIVKRNYGAKGITVDDVAKNRAKYLKAVTVMAKREPGYDEDNQNWFWVKYKPDGSYFNKMGMIPMVGRVAKGKEMGCIACHSKSANYRFTPDSMITKL